MTFICKAANLSKLEEDSEEHLMRLQVNDYYIAYTNDFGPEEESQDQIVLKGSVYAVRKRTVDDTPSEVNTRTEWKVIYIDPFSINISGRGQTISPLSISKKTLKSALPLLRDTDSNPFDMDDSNDSQSVPKRFDRCLSEENMQIKKERTRGNIKMETGFKIMPAQMDQDSLITESFKDNQSESTLTVNAMEGTDPFEDVLSERTDY